MCGLQVCTKCHGHPNWSDVLYDMTPDPKTKQPPSPCKVFMPETLLHVRFGWRACKNMVCNAPCQGRLDVDGREYGILRKSKFTAFSLWLLYRWSNHCGLRNMGWYTFLRDTLMCYHAIDTPVRRRLLANTQKHFREATLDFIQLQYIDYRNSFACPHNGMFQQFDGLTIAFKAEKCFLHRAWLPQPGGVVPGSSFHHRTFVPDSKIRALLLAFAAYDAASNGLAASDHDALVQSLTSKGGNCAVLLPFVRSYEERGGKRVATQRYSQLLFNLGTTAPAAQLLRPAAWGDVEALSGTQPRCITPASTSLLQQHNPALYDILRPDLGRVASEAVRVFLQALLRVAKCAYVHAPVAANTASPAPSRQAAQVEFVDVVGPDQAARWKEEEAYIRTGVFVGSGVGEQPGAAPSAWAPSSLGGSDVKRPLRSYCADAVGAPRTMESSCTKYKESNQSLLPGCLLGWCMSCGICNSFMLMPDAESPRTVFELLYTRWRVPPHVLCYDNGCNTMAYCLNRECEHFMSTNWYIDALHYRDHKKCATEYCSKYYRGIKNSSLAEQKNAIVRSLESSCGYMNQITFLLYIRFFLHRMNKIQRMKDLGQCFFA